MSFFVLAAACGRGGLGDVDFDPDSAVEDTGAVDTGELDTAIEDTAFDSFDPPFDTIEFDSSFDTSVEFDTFEPPFDTSVPPFDSGTFDTSVPPFDTGTFDTSIPPFDTGTFDTSIPPFDTGVFDTSVPPFDTSVPPFDTGIDGGPKPDTAFDAPPEGGILCGSTFCAAATEECCASFTGVSCTKKGTCGGGTTLNCSSAASCGGGRVCCFGGFGGGTPTATCQPFCFGVQLCVSDGECRPGQRCQVTFGGYAICR